MKKLKILFFSLFVGSLSGQTALTDSMFTYLQGDWYQSYRMLSSTCNNGMEKFDGVQPLKITYQKVSRTQGRVIREAGASFYSQVLNASFVDSLDVVRDTIQLFYDDEQDRWVSKKFLPLIEVRSQHEHVMHVSEPELCGFERDPHRAFATYLVRNNWNGGKCGLQNGEISVCLAADFINLFKLKNDTLISGTDKFVYNYENHIYNRVDKPEIRIFLMPDSSVEITDSSKFLEFFRMENSPVSTAKRSSYIGHWLSTNDPNQTLFIDYDANGGLKLCMCPPNQGSGVPQEIFTGVVKAPRYLLPVDGHYLMITNSQTCQPTYSRLELRKNNTELVNTITGEVFSKVTSINDEAQSSAINLRSNPIRDGVLVVDNLTNFNYTIYNSTGAVTKMGTSAEGVIELRGVVQGYYTLKVSAGHEVYITRFLVSN